MPAKKSVSLSASEIASHVQGELLGHGAAIATRLTSLEDAQSGALVFVREKSLTVLRDTISTAPASVFLSQTRIESEEVPPEKALIVVSKPLEALMRCMPLFFEPHPPQTGVSTLASVHPSAKIGSGVSIGEFVVVGPLTEIGDNVVIHPHVVLYPGVKIGPRSIIHSHAAIREDSVLGAETVIQNGAVIGADGFGYVPDAKLGLVGVPQLGTVNLGDRVEVGANSAIDRATLGTTTIGLGTKIDNLVQIGHNTRIGRFSILCGQVGIAGSCEIGNQVVIGGQAGVGDHLKIADGIRVGAKSGVVSDLTEKGDYLGFPPLPAQVARRVFAILPQLPDLFRKLKRG